MFVQKIPASLDLHAVYHRAYLYVTPRRLQCLRRLLGIPLGRIEILDGREFRTWRRPDDHVWL